MKTKLTLHSILWLLAVVLLLPWVVSAQMTDQSVTNLWDLTVRFCDFEDQDAPLKKSTFFTTETWVLNEICMVVDNKWPTDAKIYIDFVDGSITWDESQNKACEPSWTIANFGQFVGYDNNERLIEAWTTQQSTVQLQYPEWFSWMSYWCVTLQVIEENPESDSDDNMFRVISRRANFIDVLVWWELTVWVDITDQPTLPFDSISDSKQVSVFRNPDSQQWIARVEMINQGNIAQIITVVPTVTTMMWKQFVAMNTEEQIIVGDSIETSQVLNWKQGSHDWVPVEKKVLPWDTVSFEFALNEIMPFYQWQFTVDMQVEHTPVFEFEASTITDDIKQTVKRSLSTSFIIIPYILLGAVLLIIIIIYLLIIMKKKEDKDKDEQEHKE